LEPFPVRVTGLSTEENIKSEDYLRVLQVRSAGLRSAMQPIEDKSNDTPTFFTLSKQDIEWLGKAGLPVWQVRK
jgi:hypothetical protein